MSDEYISDPLTFVYSSLVRPAIEPGSIKEASGKSYRFCQVGATTITAGYACVYVAASPDTGDYDITATLDSGLAEGCFAGIAMAAAAPYEYAWVMRDGLYHTCTVNGAVALGNGVIIDANGAIDGSFDAAVDTGLLSIAGIAFEVTTAAATGVSIWVKAL